jgi:hypothetical protein
MRLALTLANGDVLLGEEADIQRLLRFTSGFGASQTGVAIVRRSSGPGGVEETEETARWVNGAQLVSITEETVVTP